jgi:hypothetical protein
MFNRPGGSGEADNQAQIADFDFQRFCVGPGGGDFHLVMRSVIVDQRTFERPPAVLTPAGYQQIFEQFVYRACEVAESERAAALGCS